MSHVDYTANYLAAWHRHRELQRGAVERWINAPHTRRTPINQDAAGDKPGGVATTTEATVTDTTNPTATLGDRLRAIADWLDAHPDADPYEIILRGPTLVLHDYTCRTRGDVTARIKALGGRWEKRDESDLFTFVNQITPGTEYRIAVWRSTVCERVVVGTTTVREPDPAEVAKLPTVEREIEQVEWRCPPILAEATR